MYENIRFAQKVSGDMFGLFESMFATQDHKLDYMEVYETHMNFLEGKCDLSRFLFILTSNFF